MEKIIITGEVEHKKVTGDGQTCICGNSLGETTKLLEIRATVIELIQFVVNKYSVRNEAEFTCPYHRKLAQLLGKNIRYFSD